MGSQGAAALVILCGLPGSGKTTLATALMNLSKDLDDAAVHKLSFDDEYERQRPSADEFDPVAWHKSRHVCVEEVKQILGASVEPTCMRKVIFVDDNMYYASMRREFYKLARDMHATFIQIHVLCPYELCCIRDRQREANSRVGCDVIARMKGVFDVPQRSINSWESDTLTIDSSCIDFFNQAFLKSIWEQILDILDKSPPPPEVESQDILSRQIEGQNANNASKVHSFDLWSRALLSATMQIVGKLDGRKHEMKQLGKDLNEKRRVALQTLKVEDKDNIDATIKALKKQFDLDCSALHEADPKICP